MLRVFFWINVFMGAVTAMPAFAAAPGEWTLPAAAERVWELTPRAQIANAERELRQAQAGAARAWPDPRVSARADNALGQEDGRGGYAVRELEFAQALPLRRGPQQARADAALAGAESGARSTRLQMERETAQRYHALQLRAAQYELAQRRVQAADASMRPRGKLVRYLPQAERLRLQIVHELAQQAVASAEGEWAEAVAQFRALLQLPDDAAPRVMTLAAPPAPPALTQIAERLPQHPALQQTQYALAAARAGIDVARAQRWAQVELSVIGAREYIAGERRDVTGVGVGMSLPLWRASQWPIAAAQADLTRAQAEHAALARELNAQLKQAHVHLQHLREQAEHYRARVLTAAERVVQLVRRDFNAGNANVLTLVDAENTYYESHSRYLELLHDAWNEWALLRAAAGLALTQADTIGGGAQ